MKGRPRFPTNLLNEQSLCRIRPSIVNETYLVNDLSRYSHLFWEEMKRIFYAMREVRLEDLDEETLDEFMTAMDGISNVLFRIEKRRKGREVKTGTLMI